MNQLLGVWVAFAGLSITVVSLAVSIAFFLGRLFQRLEDQAKRIAAIENADAADGSESRNLRDAVVRLETKMDHVEKGVGEINRRIGFGGRLVAEDHAPA